MRSLLLGCALLLAAAPALAEEGPRQDLSAEADLHFQIAVDHYRAGRFQAALEHLYLSNRLAPNRNVLFNIARCQEQLGDFQQAFRSYADYAAQESDPALRTTAEAAISRIRERVALVRVESDPPGATVFVDRTDLGARGTTPLVLALDPGAHTILVQAEGYRPSQAEVALSIGREARTSLPLDPILGTVMVRGGPAGARIHEGSADGPVLATVPGPARLPPGQHVLLIEADRHRPQRELVTVSADQPTDLLVDLPVVSGRLVVEAVERGARIEVDGKAVGFTPTVVEVAAGPHHVVVSLPGFRPFEQDLTVQPDASTTVEVRLRSRQEVTAASRTTQDADSAPASVSIIDAREIRAFGYQSLYEALAGTRGVYQSSDLTYQYLGFRGFARSGDYGNRVLVTVDGHTMNDDQLGASYVGSDFSTDLQDVAQIEVVRGPGSALYGSNAFFGVLNVVTRKGDRAEGGMAEHFALTGDGGRTLRGRAGLDLGDGERGLWASAAGLVSQGEDYFFPEYQSPTDPDSPADGWSRDADGAQAYTVQTRGWAGDFTVEAMVNGHSKRIPTGAFETVLGDPAAHSDDLRSFVELRYEPRLSEHMRLYSRAWMDRYSFSGAYPYEEGYLYSDHWQGTWVGAEPRLVWSPGEALSLTVGAELRQHVQAHLYSEDTDGPVLEEQPTQGVYAAYLVAQVAPLEWLHADVGARFDYFTLEGIGGTLNPRAAILLIPGEQDVAKLIVGTAFRAPSPYEWFYNDGGITQVAPVSLQPERVLTTEAEWIHHTDDITSVTAGLYYNRITDLIDTELTGEVVDESEIFRYATALGALHSVGIETELRRDWRRGWLFHLQQSVQATRADQLGLTDTITNSPAWLGSLKLAAPLLSTGATLATRLQAESPRWISTRRDPDLDRTPWALIWDLTASGQVASGPLFIGAGVRNLLDWKVEYPGGVDLQQATVPGPGRTFFATARVDL